MVQARIQKVGFYGGGFDPVHNGHLALAETALCALSLDSVIFMPSGGVSYYKNNDDLASGDDRVEMLHRAVNNNPRLRVSTYEIDQNKFCYTYDTLHHLQNDLPADTELILLIGADWKNRLTTWKHGNDLIREFSVAIFTRPGFVEQFDTDSHPCKQIFYVDMPAINVSSSGIRERIQRGESIDGMVPPSVKDYIERHKLYQ